MQSRPTPCRIQPGGDRLVRCVKHFSAEGRLGVPDTQLAFCIPSSTSFLYGAHLRNSVFSGRSHKGVNILPPRHQGDKWKIFKEQLKTPWQFICGWTSLTVPSATETGSIKQINGAQIQQRMQLQELKWEVLAHIDAELWRWWNECSVSSCSEHQRKLKAFPLFYDSWLMVITFLQVKANPLTSCARRLLFRFNWMSWGSPEIKNVLIIILQSFERRRQYKCTLIRDPFDLIYKVNQKTISEESPASPDAVVEILEVEESCRCQKPETLAGCKCRPDTREEGGYAHLSC